VANYSKLNSKKHKEITATLLNTDDNDEPLVVPVPLLPLAEYRILILINIVNIVTRKHEFPLNVKQKYVYVKTFVAHR
jgi:hypothetical protein